MREIVSAGAEPNRNNKVKHSKLRSAEGPKVNFILKTKSI